MLRIILATAIGLVSVASAALAQSVAAADDAAIRALVKKYADAREANDPGTNLTTNTVALAAGGASAPNRACQGR